MTIFDMSSFADESVESAMPYLESTPGNPRTILILVQGIIHNQTHWVLADSGLLRNLIADFLFRFLPFQRHLNHRNIQVFGGNACPINIRGVVVLPLTIGDTLI